MSEELNQNKANEYLEEEQEIDLIEVAKKLWDGRKLILKACGIAALIGLVIAFSIPKEYTTGVKLSAEKTDRRSSGNLGVLAAMAGINLSASSGNALTEDIYPDIVQSTPFLTNLFNVKVASNDGEIRTTLFNYLDKNYSVPWWSYIKSAVLSIPGKIIGLFKSEEQGNGTFNPFNLSKKERKIVGILKENIILSVDNKTGVIDVAVTMQDPLISAQLTDTILRNLQSYITEYKTNKARKDLNFAQKIYKEAQVKYDKAQDNYAHFSDKNQNIYLHSLRAEQERLQNERTLAYQVYSQASQQLEMARAKVQESTPAYMIIQPPVVPMKPSKPRKLLILIGFIFLGAAGSMAWVYFKDQIMEWKEQLTAPATNEKN